eukprot:IDg21155t1
MHRRAMASSSAAYHAPYRTRIPTRPSPPPPPASTELPFSVLMPRQLRPGDRAILEVRFVARVCGREGASAAYTVLHGVCTESDACASAIVVVKSGAPVEIVGCRLLAFEEYARYRPLWPPYNDAQSGMHAAANGRPTQFPVYCAAVACTGA